jgi:hypothetical protein
MVGIVQVSENDRDSLTVFNFVSNRGRYARSRCYCRFRGDRRIDARRSFFAAEPIQRPESRGIFTKCSLNVHKLTQESPLREYFLLALVVAFQDDLVGEVPPVIEDLFKVTVNDRYDTIVTVIFMIVVFYGAGLAVDLVKKAVSDSLPREKYEELLDFLALEVGRPVSELRQIVHARFEKPSAVRRLVGH